MEPSSPTPPTPQWRYVILGFLGLLFVFWLMFHFVFQGTLKTEDLPGWPYVDLRSPLFYIFLSLLYVMVQETLKWLWRKYPQLQKKHDEIVRSHKTIGIMTGIGYFFLLVIGLFVVIPVIALVVMKLLGKL